MSLDMPRARRDLNPRRDFDVPWLHIDPILILGSLALAVIGVLVVYSATRGVDPAAYDTFYLSRQSLFVIVGLCAMAVMASFDYQHLTTLGLPAMALAVLGLLLVLSPLGIEVNGAQAWFEIGGFQIQPSEFTKVAFIVALAAHLARFEAPLTIRHLAASLGLTAVPVVLILRQPDVGTVLVFVSIAMGMLLVAGVKVRHIVALTIVGVIGVAAVVNSPLLADYQRDRLVSFIDPDDAEGAAYNQDQAQIAIGNGGLTGTGFGNGAQTRGDFVPEQQTDFIFTVIGEELGFIGGSAVLALFALVIWRTWRAARVSRDRFGTLLCVGVLAMVVFQMFQSIGMTMGIMPVTGIPLPFVSYGGSSSLTSFAALGLVLNVHMRRYE